MSSFQQKFAGKIATTGKDGVFEKRGANGAVVVVSRQGGSGNRSPSPPPRPPANQRQAVDPKPSKPTVNDLRARERGGGYGGVGGGREAAAAAAAARARRQREEEEAEAEREREEAERARRPPTPIHIRHERARREREEEEERQRREARTKSHRKVPYEPKLAPLPPEPVARSGGLGPDLLNEERLKKAAQREKMKEFGKNVHTVNTVMMPAATKNPKVELHRDERKKAKEKRAKMIEFAKSVPKPALADRDDSDNIPAATRGSADGKPARQVSAGAQRGGKDPNQQQQQQQQQQRGLADEILEQLDELESKHRKHKMAVDSIARELRL